MWFTRIVRGFRDLNINLFTIITTRVLFMLKNKKGEGSEREAIILQSVRYQTVGLGAIGERKSNSIRKVGSHCEGIE